MNHDQEGRSALHQGDGLFQLVVRQCWVRKHPHVGRMLGTPKGILCDEFGMCCDAIQKIYGTIFFSKIYKFLKE